MTKEEIKELAKEVEWIVVLDERTFLESLIDRFQVIKGKLNA